MSYYVRLHADRRYWVVSHVFERRGHYYFGCVTYRAVVDDFGNLINVGDLR
jgi:hypothetical protein